MAPSNHSISKKRTLEVAAAIIQRGSLFLITKRLKKSHLGHCWEFPGGKRERGESLEDCVVRECQEEIGVKVVPTSLFKTISHHYPELDLILYFYLCEIAHGEPRPIECADLKWVYPEELARYEFPEADREIIQVLSQRG